jgi:hypothetical protein
MKITDAERAICLANRLCGLRADLRDLQSDRPIASVSLAHSSISGAEFTPDIKAALAACLSSGIETVTSELQGLGIDVASVEEDARARGWQWDTQNSPKA